MFLITNITRWRYIVNKFSGFHSFFFLFDDFTTGPRAPLRKIQWTGSLSDMQSFAKMRKLSGATLPFCRTESIFRKPARVIPFLVGLKNANRVYQN